jgi:hypothetical protein
MIAEDGIKEELMNRKMEGRKGRETVIYERIIN